VAPFEHDPYRLDRDAEHLLRAFRRRSCGGTVAQPSPAAPVVIGRATEVGSSGTSTAFASDQPIRGELLPPERLAERARDLAKGSRTKARKARGRPMLPRLEEDARVLLACYRDVALAIAQGRPISPAAEWLADNWHIVEEQLREIRDDLPPSF